MVDFSKELTRETLAARIDFGDDVEFECHNKSYTILGWYKGGPLISDVTVIGADDGQQFKDGADLVDHYLIDGKPIAERIGEMKML